MNKRNSKEIQDRFADSATAMVMDQYMADLTENLPAEPDDDSIEISEEFDLKCRKLINKGLAKKRWQQIGKKLTHGAGAAALAIFIFLGVLALLFTTVEAIRIPIINFFLHQKEDHLEISNDNNVAVSAGNPVEGLTPAGYELELCNIDNDDIVIMYVNPHGDYIRYFSNPSIGKLYADNEDAVTESITISDQEAILIYKDGYTLIWLNSDGSILHRLEANALSREEIIALANSIVKTQ